MQACSEHDCPGDMTGLLTITAHRHRLRPTTCQSMTRPWRRSWVLHACCAPACASDCPCHTPPTVVAHGGRPHLHLHPARLNMAHATDVHAKVKQALAVVLRLRVGCSNSRTVGQQDASLPSNSVHGGQAAVQAGAGRARCTCPRTPATQSNRNCHNHHNCKPVATNSISSNPPARCRCPRAHAPAGP